MVLWVLGGEGELVGQHASPVESDEDRIREACELVQKAVVSNGPKEHR